MNGNKAKKGTKPSRRKTKNVVVESDEPSLSSLVQNEFGVERTTAVKVVEYKQQDFREHVLTHSMWAGRKDIEEQTHWCVHKNATTAQSYFDKKTFMISDVLLKIIDEIRVNVIDQNTLFPDDVTEIDFTVDGKGEISIRNNGTGVRIEERKDRTGRLLFLPEIIFTQEMSGSNLDETKNKNVGGQNGYGSKLTNIWSDYFRIETAKDDIYYSQVCRNQMLEIESPSIAAFTSAAKTRLNAFTSAHTVLAHEKLSQKNRENHTKISFLPAYLKLNYEVKTHHGEIMAITEYYAYMTAAFTRCKVTFNNVVIEDYSWANFAMMHQNKFTMFDERKSVNLGITSPDIENPWEAFIITCRPYQFEAISVVNGIYVTKGKHIEHIKEKLYELLLPLIEQEARVYNVPVRKSLLFDCISLYMKCYVNNPRFDSQSKTDLTNKISEFRKYTIGASVAMLWAAVKPVIVMQLENKFERTNAVYSNKAIYAKKYSEAGKCTSDRRLEATLLFCEGDSAYGTVRRGLSSTKTDPTFNFENFGIFSTQGVIANALKRSKDHDDDSKSKRQQIKQKAIRLLSGDVSDTLSSICEEKENEDPDEPFEETEVFDDAEPDDSKIAALLSRDTCSGVSIDQKLQLQYLNDHIKTRMNSSLTDSKSKGKKEESRFALLLRILGLNKNCTYDFSEQGETDYKNLRYGAICGLTDQDLDGHNIFALIATIILNNWPHLIIRGYVKRLFTPLIRAYPKGKSGDVVEFYSLKEFDNWARAGGDAGKYNIDYCKGLGSHKSIRGEVDSMFSDIASKIKTFQIDEYALTSMQIYYGKDTSLRKLALITPERDEDDIESENISLTYMFEVHAKAFQRDNIIRKLPCIMDNMVRARRKVLWVGMQTARKSVRVNELASDIVKMTNYHHTPDSLTKTITYMAKAYPAARNLPMFLPYGEFGTREQGYQNYASARYIETTLNYRLVDALFKKEDFCLLRYHIDEGKQIEPFYLPAIIPTILLETDTIPGHGWQYNAHARHIDDVFTNLYAKIRTPIGEPEHKCTPLRPWRKDFEGKIIDENGKKNYVGAWTYNKDTRIFNVTGLPPMLYSEKICEAARLDPLVDSANDLTNEENINIVIQLKAGAYAKIIQESKNDKRPHSIHPLPRHFKIYHHISHCLNIVDENNCVRTFKDYADILDAWFPIRKELYKLRIERERIITELNIEFYESVQRFSQNYDAYGFNKKTSIDTIVAKLTEEKYPIFDEAAVHNPKLTDVDKIRQFATSAEHGASYKYLYTLSLNELLDAAFEKRAKKITDAKEYLATLAASSTYFSGSDIWIAELQHLESVIREGIKTNWRFGERAHNFVSSKKARPRASKK